MASNAVGQVKDIITDETGETTFDVGDMLVDGAIGAIGGFAGGNGASYGNAKAANSLGNQFFGKVFDGKTFLNGASLYKKVFRMPIIIT